MKECRVFVPYGAVGANISDEAFACGMALKPDIISTDAGSTDSGPFYLGTGTGKYAKAVIRRDLKRIILAAHAAGIPVTIGSAGTCGSDQGVDMYAQICEEIAAEAGFSLKIAKIYTEQDPEVLKQKYRQGKVHELNGAPHITEEVFDECTHIVALAGIEPFMEALKQGADVVVCGRATDTAVIAAYPIMMGCSPAASWHAAKTAECGCLCTTKPTDGGVFLTIDETGFTVQATDPEGTCTPYTVSAHLLYENADPYRLREPGVLIDTEHAVYTQMEGGKVRVEGTAVQNMPYTMKLEGASETGYQTVTMVGIADREIMQDPMRWLSNLQAYVQVQLDRMGFRKESYSYDLLPYGYNAVTGHAPEGYVPNEMLVMLRVTAETEELSLQIAKVFNPLLLHFPVHRDKPLPSFAFPLSPAENQRGKQYAFRLYHVVDLEDPLELCRIVIDRTEKKETCV